MQKYKLLLLTLTLHITNVVTSHFILLDTPTNAIVIVSTSIEDRQQPNGPGCSDRIIKEVEKRLRKKETTYFKQVVLTTNGSRISSVRDLICYGPVNNETLFKQLDKHSKSYNERIVISDAKEVQKLVEEYRSSNREEWRVL